MSTKKENNIQKRVKPETITKVSKLRKYYEMTRGEPLSDFDDVINFMADYVLEKDEAIRKIDNLVIYNAERGRLAEKYGY